MCEFAILNNPHKGMILCGPLNKLCTMCFMGNFNQYAECKKVIDETVYRPPVKREVKQ